MDQKRATIQFLKFAIIVVAYTVTMLAIGYCHVNGQLDDEKAGLAWVVAFMFGLPLVLYFVSRVDPIPPQQRQGPYDNIRENLMTARGRRA